MKIIKKVFACLLSVLFILSLVSINTQNVKAAVDHCTIEFAENSDGFTITCPESSFAVNNTTWFELGFSNNNSDFSVGFFPTMSSEDGNTVLFVSDGWSQYHGYIPKGIYKLKLKVADENTSQEIKLNNDDDTAISGFNQPYPSSVSISMNENMDLIVSCDRTVNGI